MAFIPALIPLGVGLSKISRNINDDGLSELMPYKDRGRAIVNRMITGGANAPITSWSEAKLEKVIRRNSVFRDHANELRNARVNGLLSCPTSTDKKFAQARSSIASVVDSREQQIQDGNGSIASVVDRREQEIQDGNVPDTLCDADLLLLAAEAETKANPARDVALELLADNSFDAILITDAEGTIAYSNKSFTKLTGYDQAEVLGKSPKLLQGPGTDKKVLARLKESMHKGNGDYEGSAINYRKNGTPFIMHWRVVPVKIGGEIKAWIAIQREGSQIPTADVS